MNAVWVDEWSVDLAWHAKRAKRRPSHREHGTEEYLVSGTDTSHLARRADG